MNLLWKCKLWDAILLRARRVVCEVKARHLVAGVRLAPGLRCGMFSATVGYLQSWTADMGASVLVGSWGFDTSGQEIPAVRRAIARGRDRPALW